MKSHKPNPFLFGCRLLGFSSITVAAIFSLLFAHLFPANSRTRKNLQHKIMHWWGKWCCRNNGYDVTIKGKLPDENVFIAANHISYADILVLSASFPCSFVSKFEVAKWPLIGIGARLTNTIFVSRRVERALADIKQKIMHTLQTNSNVIVFLESTSSNGAQVLPFRSPLLQAPIETNSMVVPLAIRWSTQNPNLDVAEEIAYWRDEHYLMPHLVNHLGKNSKQVEIVIGAPISPAGLTRKQLCERAYNEVTRLFSVD